MLGPVFSCSPPRRCTCLRDNAASTRLVRGASAESPVVVFTTPSTMISRSFIRPKLATSADAMNDASSPSCNEPAAPSSSSNCPASATLASVESNGRYANAFLDQSAMAIVQSAIHVDVSSTRGVWPPLFRFISRARSLVHTPYRTITPAGKCLSSPRCVVILVANVAGVRDLQRICFAGRYEVKGMAADVYVGDRLLDLRHVASRALAARTVRLVMRVGF